MLEEQGVIALEDPLATHLPDVQISNAWAGEAPVRLSHVLEHSGGLNDIAFRHYFISSSETGLARAVEVYTPYRARWRPGVRTSYSNAGPILAGRVLEVVTSQPFEEWMQARLFNPLGMHDSVWTVTEAQRTNRLASSYGADGVTREPVIDPPGRPSGGLNTTVVDLAQLPRLMLARGNLDAVRYFSSDSARRLETPATSAAARGGLVHGTAPGNVADVAGQTVWYGHDGTIDGFRAAARYSTELDAGYVILTNSLSPEFEAVERMVRTYLERGLAPTEPQAVSMDAEKALRATGQYQTLTPRRHFLAPLIGLTQWEGARFDGERLRFRQESLVHVGGGRFQGTGQAAPSTILLEIAGRYELHTGTGAYRRVPAAELWIKVGAVSITILALAGSIFYAFVWGPSLVMGRLSARGGATVRALPCAGLILAVSAGLAPLIMLQTASFETLGRPSPGGWLVYALTILGPAAALIATGAVMKGRGAGRAVMIFASLQSGIALMISAYLVWGGWFALRIWNA